MKQVNNKSKKQDAPIYCKIKGSNIIYILKDIKDGIAKLSFKNKSILVNEKDILILEEYTPTNEVYKASNCSFNPCNSNAKTTSQSELMLRLLTVDEAIPLLDKFIDNAVVLKLPSVKIIHGKRGGIIKKAVHEYLDKSEFIDSYTYAEYFDGSYGATVAQIKRWN